MLVSNPRDPGKAIVSGRLHTVGFKRVWMQGASEERVRSVKPKSEAAMRPRLQHPRSS
jgi:hypothetical protein